MSHPAEEHSIFLVDIIEVAVDSVDICTYLISNFPYFFYILILVLLTVSVMILLLYVVFAQRFPLQFTLIMFYV